MRHAHPSPSFFLPAFILLLTIEQLVRWAIA